VTKFAVAELAGKRFGRLVVQERAGKDPSGKNWFWRCACDCGGLVTILASSLRQNRTRSCGCLQKEVRGVSNKTHGHTSGGKISSEYTAWQGLLDRCFNPNNNAYAYYGGRGITVCDRWQASFENFLDDIGNKPSPKHSLDRTDVNGNYEPSNCKWATKEEQMINRRVHCARCGREIFCSACSNG
jgi:hypothetical protein